MSTWSYRAFDKSGKEHGNTLAAESFAEALSKLTAKGFSPVEIKLAEPCEPEFRGLRGSTRSGLNEEGVLA